MGEMNLFGNGDRRENKHTKHQGGGEEWEELRDCVDVYVLYVVVAD